MSIPCRKLGIFCGSTLARSNSEKFQLRAIPQNVPIGANNEKERQSEHYLCQTIDNQQHQQLQNNINIPKSLVKL